MFDVGFWELLLIGVVTLLVVGPDRLPEVARTAGKWVLKARRFVAGVKSDFQSELESGELHKILGDQKEQIKELRSMVDSTRKDFETSASDAVSTAKAKFSEIDDLGRDTLKTTTDKTTVEKSTEPAIKPAQTIAAPKPAVGASSSTSASVDSAPGDDTPSSDTDSSIDK